MGRIDVLDKGVGDKGMVKRFLVLFAVFTSLFPASVESENVYLSVYLCNSNTLGQPGDFKKGRIRLKFCTLVPWVNIWVVFLLFKKFDFWGPRTSFRQA